ncbi:uncharacterized protein LOC115624933 [Scaptodrosophila lebanonensis]|uniref:Uncharacterized protein LOC115624933 n=1 Tax=Drosophila lebanonensis TaxID=7225 RepID=A0A6J2TKG5_DROLE|nr:uncharacterized protein LOC115624933 [Scaptodrosophila lebanonensis]
MGNRMGSGIHGDSPGASQFNTRRRYQQHKREYCLQDEYRSKTLPARRGAHDETGKSSNQRVGSSGCLATGGGPGGAPLPADGAATATPTSGETSRVLFLLYLIHRTWNVVMDTMDTRTKSRSSRNASSPQKEVPNEVQSRRPDRPPDNVNEECSIGITDIDASSYCSQYSCCSCSYCDERGVPGAQTNDYSSIADNYSLDSIFEPPKSMCPR